MSDYTWGTTTLIVDAYERLGPRSNLSEHPLIPSVGSTSAQSVLMGTGVHRQRFQITGWASTSDYDSLEDDYRINTTRTATFGDGHSLTAAIETLRARRDKNVDGLFYTAVFVEV